MNKRVLSLIVGVTLLGAALAPVIGHADRLQDLNNELKAIEKKTAEAKKKIQEAERAADSLKSQKAAETKNLEEVRKDIEDHGKKLNEIKMQKLTAIEDLDRTAVELQQADDRVAERDRLLKSRVRLMYMNGSVSYLDVILSATSFSDFLDRFYALQNVVGQDKTILEANKADRQIIAAKEEQQKVQLAQVTALEAEEEAVKQKLLTQEKQKQVMIASLAKQEEAAEEISEEQEQAVKELALRQQKVIDEKRKEQEKLNKKPATPAPKYSGGKLGWPIQGGGGTISDNFGYRIDPIKKIRKLHKGIDIAAPRGTSIVAAEEGDVLIADWTSGYGNTVVINHGNGMWTWYGHIREGGINVKVGDHVKRGQKIAEVGSTGDSTGNHLHFEVRMNQEATDPMPYLK